MTERPIPADPPSPCVAVCVMNTETGWCLGCYRTMSEIAGWVMLTPAQRREVLARVAERKAQDGRGPA
jgi:predicted Fe-S protein YdhL (DUF1289 family)